ncbi:MAG TPA: flavodoxin domain-containing protein [Candidatus Limnocylindrales bacterium]|nr:flavodoxin domain-containing protein [Candidatus Limnocylindrales bacterium]
MSTASIVYRSRTGTTRQLAEEIASHLRTRGVEASVMSVGDCDIQSLAEVDFLLLGCWTGGLFVIAQHPDEPWLAFARDLPGLARPRVGLFTTYKLVTGSMFARMRAALEGKISRFDLELKSRNGHLTSAGRLALDQFVGVG